MSALTQVGEGVLRIYLPELRRINIYGNHQANGTLRVDGDSLLVSGKLQALSLHRDVTVTFMPDSFMRLTALARLTLVACGLVEESGSGHSSGRKFDSIGAAIQRRSAAVQ